VITLSNVNRFSQLLPVTALAFRGPMQNQIWPPRIAINAYLYSDFYDGMCRGQLSDVRLFVCLSCASRSRYVLRIANYMRVGGRVLFSLDGRRRWSADPILVAADTSIGGRRSEAAANKKLHFEHKIVFWFMSWYHVELVKNSLTSTSINMQEGRIYQWKIN